MTRREATKLIALGTGALILPAYLISNNLPTMQTRRIPSTQEELPVIGLGTWQTFDVGHTASERNPLKKVLQILVEHGGSVIDSSPMYGRSEGVVGDLTTELQVKNQIFEATKVWTSGSSAGRDQIADSMSLMKARPLDLMQIHNLLDWKTHLRTLRDLKTAGKIRYIGITHYHSGAYAEMEKIILEEPIDFIQVNYNLAVRDADKRLLPLAKDKGIAVMINRPYEGGSLFRKVKNQSLPSWATETGIQSWGQFFLKFILAHDAVTCVIPGTAKAHHMLDNVGAGYGESLDDKSVAKMIDLVKGL